MAATATSPRIQVAPASVQLPAGSQGPVTFTVVAVDDSIDQVERALAFVALTTSSAVQPLWAASRQASVTVVDNDVSGVRVTASEGMLVSEDGAMTAEISVVLTSQPVGVCMGCVEKREG